MDAITQAKHTAQVFLSECRSRRHGHGFWFAFRGAQNARRRAAGPLRPAAVSPAALPAQMELFL
jgi:hypothetical protein